MGRGTGEDLCRRRSRPAGRAVTSGCTISAACASRKWTRPASTCRCISHGAPSTQKLPADTAAALTRRVNDRLAAASPRNPHALRRLRRAADRGAGRRRRRTRTHRQQLGFKGAMLHGLANGVFLDDKRFWPIYARAEKLDVPIYLHPALPHRRRACASITTTTSRTSRWWRAPAWGYTVETATLAIRLVLSGVFEQHPEAENHSRPSRRDAAVSGLAHRPGAGAAGPEVDELPRHLLQQLLHHHERQLLQSGAALLRHGNGHRPYPVRRRLAVRDEPAGDAMDGRPCRSATRTRRRSSPATPSGC